MTITIETDPFQVFGPEYWGAIQPRPAGSEMGPTSLRVALQLGREIRNYIRPIIKGDLHGIQVSPGVVFDPVNEEPDISFYYPGTVLLMDSETVGPVNPQHVYEEEVDEGLLGLSPRAFLREQVASLEDRPVQKLNPGTKRFTDGERAYARQVDIISLAHNRRKGSAIYRLGAWITVPALPVLADSVFLAPARLPGGRARSVGETYQYGADSESLARIRSLEICVTGQPVPVDSPGFSLGFLSKFVKSPVAA